MNITRGYFEIGILNGKNPLNVGTLWRSAFQLGATGIFTIGRRYPMQPSDTVKAERHIPLRQFLTFADFLLSIPKSCQLIGVDMGGSPIVDFAHPERAFYLLGSEDTGLSSAALDKCQHFVSLPSVRTESFNVAVAGSLVMFDRLNKRERFRASA